MHSYCDTYFIVWPRFVTRTFLCHHTWSGQTIMYPDQISRYSVHATITKPTFRFEYVHVYCQLVDQPGKHFCDKILSCNDACMHSYV